MADFPGLVTKASPYAVRETVDRLENLLREKGVKVFARIDQAAEAKAAGLNMPPMELLIFGNPKGGTPILLAQPEAGIDLPLKAMAWQGPDGKTRIAFNDAAYLESRFHLTPDLVLPLAGIARLVEAVVAP